MNEWIYKIKQALQQGLTKEEVLEFIQKHEGRWVK